MSTLPAARQEPSELSLPDLASKSNPYLDAVREVFGPLGPPSDLVEDDLAETAAELRRKSPPV